MSKFDKIIGYESIKNELHRIADTLKNIESYKRLGVTSPRGLLLYGVPGVGKSLMAEAVIEESGRKAFICRKSEPNGDFIKTIKATFEKAAENTPSIVFLDDMDKFANGDEEHPDAEEYVTVQSCIDDAKGKDVFVLATVNNMDALPQSLCRAGRFDRTIRIGVPKGRDAISILSHYLKSKKIVGDVDIVTIARIMDGHSCAELETLINEAGFLAGYDRAEYITMEHFMEAIMRTVYNLSALDDDDDDGFIDIQSAEFKKKLACHEAGHAVVSEILCPGSVTLISTENRSGSGFTSYYYDNEFPSLNLIESNIIASLGGVAATEQKYGTFDIGCESDLDKAFKATNKLVTESCISGFALYGRHYIASEQLQYDQERIVAAEIEKFYKKAKEILALNNEFFEKLTACLIEKELISAVDIKKIKSECKLVPVAL